MRFSDITVPAPTAESLRADIGGAAAAIRAAETPAAALAAFDEWERRRRRVESHSALVNLAFTRDVRDPASKAAREAWDALEPTFKEYETEAKRAMLESPHRAALQAELGDTAFALWECSVTTFDPVIADDVVRESNLISERMELEARAELKFAGETVNLSGIMKHFEAPDRAHRHAAQREYWGWFSQNGETCDRIYGDLVALRTGMAKKLGFASFTELGYSRMSRLDYGQNDVEAFRAEVRERIVPLATELRARQARDLGVEKLMYWDEKVVGPEGNPSPGGDEAWMTARAREMFAELHPELASFFDQMADGGFLDLTAREGKAGGGYCTSFPSFGHPYIFANFNGTKGDVEVFTHEAGHAFQCWKSRDKRISEYLWPTMESCEIHSMSLEFLTAPQMHRFFGADAARFERTHLMESLLFLPYGCAVDDFQHRVYAEPDATPARRREMWLEVEAAYLPHRDYGDLAHPASGGFWHRQGHIFFAPFYYIDYALAQTCALQFWVQSRADFGDAMRRYVELCGRGGEAPFGALARGAGLRSPFEAGCLADVVEQAAAFLGV
ncbi:MAG: M3 family oligoendopeptidase [Myxococcales bacterium]|nr:M3 family oligoendopeptidase [Myxococcales bacterium]